MKKIDRDGNLLCYIQAEIFEKSVDVLNMSSSIFVRRFANSKIVKDLDSGAYLDGYLTIDDIFQELDEEYGSNNYGTIKYRKDVMHWCGYLYRYFAYTYEISTKRAFILLPFKDTVGAYEAYHTLDIKQAIERLLEEKGISFEHDDILKLGIETYRKIRALHNC